MSVPVDRSITHHFASLTDPRVDRTKDHQLLDILAIAICAIICGANSWTDIALFGQRKQPWLQTFLALPNGIPSHDTFGRVFAALDPVQFEACFLRWIQALRDRLPGQVVAYVVAEFKAEMADVPEELLRQEAGRFYDVFVCPLPDSLEPIVRMMYSKEQFEELVVKAWMHSYRLRRWWICTRSSEEGRGADSVLGTGSR